MRRDDLYLHDIIEAADHIATFLIETDLEGFQKSELVRSAVVHKLSIIGEAAARISDEPSGRYPRIPWPQIVAFPEHTDSCIFLERSLKAGKIDCPTLREQAAKILASAS